MTSALTPPVRQPGGTPLCWTRTGAWVWSGARPPPSRRQPWAVGLCCPSGAAPSPVRDSWFWEPAAPSSGDPAPAVVAPLTWPLLPRKLVSDEPADCHHLQPVPGLPDGEPPPGGPTWSPAALWLLLWALGAASRPAPVPPPGGLSPRAPSTAPSSTAPGQLTPHHEPTVGEPGPVVRDPGAVPCCPRGPAADRWRDRPGEVAAAAPLRAMLPAEVSPDLAAPEAAGDVGRIPGPLLPVGRGRRRCPGVSARLLDALLPGDRKLLPWEPALRRVPAACWQGRKCRVRARSRLSLALHLG